ncbi:hypothetical protein [Gluconacetobacter entanii]|uniref:hypothetical protein n=1 Tax=Gluconacetobacter entanii TaxID=108528 RepID=UPI0011B4ED99|nr:hypothetical protein [Gluconacetobacter entanii]
MKLINLKDAMCGLGLSRNRNTARRLISTGAVSVDGYVPDHAIFIGLGVQITVKRIGSGVVSRAILDGAPIAGVAGGMY